jgi:hypothetical protein
MVWAFALFLGFSSMAMAAETAFSALTALPAEDRIHLARIEGPEGNLQPDRWYFAVYAADSASGLREYVVAGHRIVARREISQFASGLTAQDVVDSRFVHTDSSEVEKLAKDFAAANNQVIATLSLTLAKPFGEGRPIWTARCFNPSGVAFGYLVVAAENGTIFGHEGFLMEPGRLLPSSELAGQEAQGHPRRHHPQASRFAFGPGQQGFQTGLHSKQAPSTPGQGQYRPAPTGRPWWVALAH